MPLRYRPRRADCAGLELPRLRKKGISGPALVLLLVILLLTALYAVLYLRALSSDTALSDARDTVTLAINDTVRRVLQEERFAYGDFVTLEKDTNGYITAITTNTSRVNLLSAEVLTGIAAAADNGALDIRIPLGSLIGENLLLGRGPRIPVHVTMLTSPRIRFENRFTSVGINQSRHTLSLIASVDIDLIIPWGTMSATVDAEVLIAETVILGRVPDAYMGGD